MVEITEAQLQEWERVAAHARGDLDLPGDPLRRIEADIIDQLCAALRAAREPGGRVEAAAMAVAAVELLKETAETEAHQRLKEAVAAYLLAAQGTPP